MPGMLQNAPFELQSRGLALNPHRSREGQGGFFSWFKSLPPTLFHTTHPPPAQVMGTYGGWGGEPRTQGRWGADPTPAKEPETQPGAGRTRVDLLWQRSCSEQWLMPGFVNVGQCSHTPTEMALFSKIQPAPTVFLRVQQSRVYQRINPGVITAGLICTWQGAPGPSPAHPSTLRKLLGGSFL